MTFRDDVTARDRNREVDVVVLLKCLASLVMILLLHAAALAQNPHHAETIEASVESSVDADGLETLANAYSVDTEKKRVPKHREKKKEDVDEDREDEDDDDDPCFGLLSGCLLDMFLSDSDDEPEPQHDYVMPSPLELSFAAGSVGLVSPGSPLANSVTLWSAAGAAAVAAEVVGEIPRGSQVRVKDSGQVGAMRWLNVSAEDPAGITGWVPAEDFTLIHDGVPPEEAAEAAGRPLVLPVRQLSLDVALGGVFNAGSDETALDDEYGGPAVRFGAGVRFHPAGAFRLALDYHYIYESGDPKFDYVSGDTLQTGQIDRPWDSSLKIHEIRLLAGMTHIVNLETTYVAWGIGPSLVRVREEAEIGYDRFEDGEIVSSGRREDSLAKWTGGIAGEANATWRFGESTLLGFDLGLSYVFWDGDEEESLTLDWLDSNGFLMLHIGFTVEFASFP